MSIKASRRFYGIGLALLASSAFVACSSDDPAPNTGGAAGKAGSSTTGGTLGTGGNGTAGTPTAGTSSAGTSSAGTTATGGSGGSGGSGSGQACAAAKPASNLITSFADLVASTSTPGQFTFMQGVPGGTFTYSAAAIKAEDTGMALHITGNVSDYHGFGVYLNSCTDASMFTGVSFNIKGNAGSSAKLNFRIQINSDTKVDVANKKGTCVVPTGMMDYEACHSPSVDITDITPAGKTVTLEWSKLTGGAPVAQIKPEEIVGFEWAFTWPNTTGTGGGASSGGAGGAGGGASGGSGGASGGSGGASGGSGGASGGSGGAAAAGYPVDLTIDEFTFLGGSGTTGGSGGTGGGASGGSGGSGGASGGSGGSTP